MSTLHAEDRRLLWLCDVRCLPTSRVTAMTGIKPETLRVRRFRARAQIARHVQEQTGDRPSDLARDRRADSGPCPTRAAPFHRPIVHDADAPKTGSCKKKGAKMSARATTDYRRRPR